MPGEKNKELTPEEQQAARDRIASELWEDGQPANEEPGQDDLEGKPEKDEDKKEPPDPWAGVSPTLRTQFEAIKAKADQFETVSERLKQAERRIGSITNELGQAKKAAEDTTKKEKEAPTKEQIDAAAQSDEAWKDLKEDYPEWAEAMDKRLAAETAKVEKRLKELGDKIESLSGLKENQGAPEDKIQELKVEFSKQLVSLQHPKWEETVKSKEFVDFIATQPDEIKAKCGSYNPMDAIEVLDLFTGKENGGQRKSKTAAEIAEDRRRRLAGSETHSAGRVRKPTKRPEDMSDEEYRQMVANEVWNS